ncbi:MAG: BamA/TamA family outer membrane protein [Chlorobium limicola]|uniref:BamA/TamA family outer membrane protein n=1 Tax=Chlorobium limicola TaxID=1092 RepID=UPI0023F5707E|nr:BamA/TamA family outer membrane protein [Chlorobium limicola]NTV21416.1 BamA/TamA family outer membrane protein [Chlorobium limicola]
MKSLAELKNSPKRVPRPDTMNRKKRSSPRSVLLMPAALLLTCILLLPARPFPLYASGVSIVFPDTLSTPFKRFSLKPFMRPARKTVGVALSGGGANGIAQIGVLKALDEERIPVDYIAGTSMGAIVGGLYSCGYSPADLEKIAETLPWQSVLSIREENPRARIFLEQQRIRDRSTIAIRFDKLKLMIPKSLSSAQALTGTLDLLILNGVYHSWQDFNSLPVQFRAVSTDLISGKRITLTSGSLSEAMRASSTIPVLFEPIERDGYRLVDGGLVANLPVDELDVVNASYKIAVDTHGSMYSKSGDLDLPWKAADQAITILTGLQYPAQLEKADLVITPDLQSHSATDFSDVKALVDAGYKKGKVLAGTIRRSIENQPVRETDIGSYNKSYLFDAGESGNREHAGIVSGIVRNGTALNRTLRELLETDLFTSVYAVMDKSKKNIVFHLTPLPRIARITITGGPHGVLSIEESENCFRPVIGQLYTNATATRALEDLVRIYRKKGYSLVEPQNVFLAGDNLQVTMSSGMVNGIEIVQNRNSIGLTPIMREIKIDTTTAVRAGKAEESAENLYETGVFSRVSLSAEKSEFIDNGSGRTLTFSLIEKPSSVLRLGLRYDETSNAQFLLDLRNENIGGTTSSFGGWIKAGQNNSVANLEFAMPRIGSTHFTLFSRLFFDQREFDTRDLRFSTDFDGYATDDISSYGIQRYGISGAFGTRIRKNGRFAIDFTLQNAQSYHATDLGPSSLTTDDLNLLSVGASLTIDSRNSAQIPTSGSYTHLSYSVTPELLDNDASFWQLSGIHEENIPLGSRTTLQLSGSAGISGSYLPLSEQFFLGGPGNTYSRRFIGLKQNDLIGSNMATAGLQLSYSPPFEIIFPASFLLQYNAGNVWNKRSDMSLSKLIHGIGTGIVWNTPAGPAKLTVSKGFAFLRGEGESESSSLRFSDTLWYFSLGHDF